MTTPITVLTGPVRSGKTTRLSAWAAERADVGGVLQPVGRHGRLFVDVETRDTCALEPAVADEAVAVVGRFRFRAAAFDWANARLFAAAARPDLSWTIVDEIGPLELGGHGLRAGLQAVLHGRSAGVLVVREGLVTPVIQAFDLAHATILPAEAWPHFEQAARGVP